MAKDALGKITEAEALADAKIAEAKAEAKQIIATAEKEGQAELVAAQTKAEDEVSGLLAKAEDAAAGASLEITSSTERECEKLRILAKGRLNEAAAFIAEKVPAPIIPSQAKIVFATFAD